MIDSLLPDVGELDLADPRQMTSHALRETLHRLLNEIDGVGDVIAGFTSSI